MTQARRSTVDRQAELTDAALEIIATQGVAALNTRALAKQVGLSSGAMFRHFASLDELYEAVVTRVEQVLQDTYPSTDLPPMERLQAFLLARSTAAGRQRGIPRLVLSEQFQLAMPLACAVRLASCVADTRLFIRRCVEEGQQCGVMRSDVDANPLSLLVMGAMQMLALADGHTCTRTAPRTRDRARPRVAEVKAVQQALATLLQPVAEMRQDRGNTNRSRASSRDEPA